MKNEMVLDGYVVGELTTRELKAIDGGSWLGDLADKLLEKAVKFTWTGFGDGNPANDEVDLYILGYKIF